MGIQAAIAEIQASQTDAGNAAAQQLLIVLPPACIITPSRRPGGCQRGPPRYAAVEARAADLVTHQCALAISEGLNSTTGAAADRRRQRIFYKLRAKIRAGARRVFGDGGCHRRRYRCRCRAS